ncbi:MAG: lipopolysaccharide heptosyltransferase II [Candidatus Omnitrophota bacterium]
MKDYKRILIVEVNWLGDVLFSTPLVKAIRKKYKNAYIACMVVPRCRQILEYSPYIDEIITYDEKKTHRSLFGKIRLIAILRRRDFDLAILLHRSFTRALIAMLAGIRERIGYITEKGHRMLTRPIEPPESPVHKVEYFLKLAESLGCDISNKDYDFFISDRERDHINKELSLAGIEKEDLLVVVNPGGNWRSKRWSEDNFAKLCKALFEKFNIKIVISGAKKDVELASRIKEKAGPDISVFAGKTDLKELGALMGRANFVISADSGPMHIAVSMGSNVIALFGPTSPELTGPYGNGNYRVIRKNTECETPCYDVTCNDHRCMDSITVEDVLETFEEMYCAQMGKK